MGVVFRERNHLMVVGYKWVGWMNIVQSRNEGWKRNTNSTLGKEKKGHDKERTIGHP